VDAHLSFYSGHSSTSFAAAVSGAFLFAEGAPDEASRCVMWATEFALAAATANFRVRAGKHYYSDVLVGALVGSALGVSVPLLSGASYAPTALEYASMGGGLVVGATLSQIVPLEATARQVGLESIQVTPMGGSETGLRLVGTF